MATVPIVGTPQVQTRPMSPVYSSGAGNTPDAFGAIGGRGLIQAGQAIQEVGTQVAAADKARQAAADKIKAQQDAIARVRDLNAVTEKLRADFLTEQTAGEGFASPASVKTYREGVDRTIGEALAQHSGSDMSRLLFGEMLQKESGQYQQKAVDEGIKAGRGMLQNQFGEFVSEQAQIAGDNPGHLADAFANIEDRLANYDAALSIEDKTTMRHAAYEQVAVAAVDHYATLGQYAEARNALAGVVEFIGPDKARALRQTITVGEVAGAKEDAKRNGMKMRLATAGVNVNDPRIALAIEGITLPARGPQTLVEKVRELEAVTGQRATQDQMAKMAGALVQEGGRGAFGQGESGLAMQHLVENLVPFSQNTLSPKDREFFIAAATIVASPDRLTGQPGTLTPAVREALRLQGIDPNTLGTSQGTRAEEAVQLRRAGGGQQAAGQGEQLAEAAADMANVVEQTRPLEIKGGILAPEAPLPTRKIYDSAALLTGPVSGTLAKAGETALVGEFINSPQVTQARSFLQAFQNDFLRVLQNNPRYSEGERQAITKAIDLEGAFLGRPGAFRDKLIGLDDQLALRESNAKDTIEKGRVSQDERAHTLNVLNAITRAREVLGVPPRIPSEAEYLKLPSGAHFIAPDGTERVKP